MRIKTRPSQTEALEKFAQTVAIEEQLPAIRKQLEPKQLCLMPDGPVIVARVLRGWAHDMIATDEGESTGQDGEDDEDVITSTDLENAYGRMASRLNSLLQCWHVNGEMVERDISRGGGMEIGVLHGPTEAVAAAAAWT